MAWEHHDEASPCVIDRLANCARHTPMSSSSSTTAGASIDALCANTSNAGSSTALADAILYCARYSNLPDFRVVEMKRLISLKIQMFGVWSLLIGMCLPWGVGAAEADDQSDCAALKVIFDGNQPVFFDVDRPRLTYATVTGAKGSGTRLYPTYPPKCASVGKNKCLSQQNIPMGEIVAVAKRCGPWAYVQHIGQSKVRTGWVALPELNPEAVPASNKDSEAHPEVSDIEPASSRYRFFFKKGRGLPVCEAYLQRLNQALYYRAPSCGRPELTSVPGFTHLKRHWLSYSEGEHIETDLDGRAKDPELPMNSEDTSARLPQVSDKHAVTVRDERKMDAWQPIGGINIENDGAKENVLMLGERDYYICGSDKVHTAGAEGLILSSSSDRVDIARTIDIFGKQRAPPLSSQHPNDRYYPIGVSMGIFQFRNITYFDTFLDQPQTDAEISDEGRLHKTLAVFTRKDHKTYERCEYLLRDKGEK